MSLGSANYISSTVPFKNLFWVIEKLGYVETLVPKELKQYYKKCIFGGRKSKI